MSSLENQTRRHCYHNLEIQRETLEWVDRIKYLVVHRDANLNFDKHVSILHLKAVNKLGILRKAREYVDIKNSYDPI